MKQLLPFLFSMVLLSFISNAQTPGTIPNRDFETWDSTAYNDLNSPWVTTNLICIDAIGSPNVTKVAGFSGEAVHLQTYISKGDTIAGEITNYGNLSVGVPYTQSPTGIKGYYRCNMVGNDKGWLVLEFLQAGNLVGFDTIAFTGSVSSFTAFNRNFSLLGTPDTMIVVAISSNIIDDIDVNAGSWLELDELSFTGTGITQQIGDGNFDSWSAQSVDVPQGWQIATPNVPGIPTGVSRSSDHYSGKYSIKIVAPAGAYGAQLTSGIFDQNGNLLGGEPYQQTVDTLTGYYKFITTGQDSGGLLITLQNQGNMVLQAGGPLPGVATWTPFQMLINSTSTPDTMRIDVYSSINGTGGGTLYLDDLQLKSQPHTAGISLSSKNNFGVSAFPDPAKDQLNIRFGGNVPEEFGLKIFNSDGGLMLANEFSSGASTVTIPIDKLSSGLYFYEVTSNDSIVRNKFVKQ